jgi:hypothetical protein
MQKQHQSQALELADVVPHSCDSERRRSGTAGTARPIARGADPQLPPLAWFTDFSDRKDMASSSPAQTGELGKTG